VRWYVLISAGLSIVIAARSGFCASDAMVVGVRLKVLVDGIDL